MPESATRRFTPNHQVAFAALSGDWNPMHVDAVVARRTLFGEPVVHGVHTLLWALEVLGRRGPLAHLEAKFLKGIPLDSEVQCVAEARPSGGFQLVVLANGSQSARIKGTFGKEAPDFPLAHRSASRQPRGPISLRFDEAPQSTGSIPLAVDEPALRRLFPVLVDLIPLWQIAVILATTEIVGMECPGLHSLYAGLTLKFGQPCSPARLCYETATADPRFSSVVVSVSGSGVEGTLRAVFRAPPQLQPSLADARAHVQAGEFSGWRALVVGGSRGLGEAAAKLIAAGGGGVCITYASGEDDARRIVAELTSARCEAHCTQLDVTGSNFPPLPFHCTHLLYFATPHIPTNTSNRFSTAIFERLCGFYVGGFQFVVTALGHPMKILYPSTDLLSAPPPNLIEYCAAKAAGEVLCGHLQRTLPDSRILLSRLPRVRTDQTAGVDAAPAMPSLLRELRILSALT